MTAYDVVVESLTPGLNKHASTREHYFLSAAYAKHYAHQLVDGIAETRQGAMPFFSARGAVIIERNNVVFRAIIHPIHVDESGTP